MIKIGCNVDNWRHENRSVEYAIEKVAELGFPYVELQIMHGLCFFPGLGFCPMISPAKISPVDLKKKLSDLGLQVSQVDASYPLNAPEATEFGVPYIKKAIRFASAIGAPCVDTTDGAAKTVGLTDEQVFDIMKRNLDSILKTAESHEVIVNVEPHGPYTTSLEGMKRIMSFSDSEYLGINFDTGNTFIAGRDPAEFLEAVADRVTHVHCKDVHPDLAKAMRGELHGIASSAIAIGYGVNADNIKACIELLKKRGWDGVFSIESEGEENVKKSYAWLKSVI